MKANKKIIAFVSVAAATLFCLPATAINANAGAVSHITGDDQSNVIVLNDNCPVEVEEENITFNITDLPSNELASDEQAFLNYSSNVVAEYNLYNPKDYDVTLSLGLPVADYPSYGYRKYDSVSGTTTYADTFDKYVISLDGQNIQKTVKYAYTNYYSTGVESQIKSLNGNGHEHINTNATFKTFEYDVQTQSGEGDNVTTASYAPSTASAHMLDYDYVATLTITMPKSNIILLEDCIFKDYHFSDDKQNIVVDIAKYVNEGSKFELTIFGDVEDVPTFSLNQFITLTDAGTLSPTSQKEETFTEYALQQKGANNVNIPDDNWVEIFADMLESNYEEDSVNYYYYKQTVYATTWYLYDITIPAGGRVVNKVTSPLYPTVWNNMGANTRYYYGFDLPGVKLWADFKKVNITVNTSYYLRSAVPENFAKKDNCYTVTTDGVPDYNIFLYISKNEQDVKTAEDYLPQIIIAMFYAEFIMIFVKFLTAGIVLLIYAAKKK